MEKVEEPNIQEVWECRRCNQSHCGYCVDLIEVNFDVRDKSDGFNAQEEEWTGQSVCPWCYNQLIDKVQMEISPDSSTP